MAVINGAPANGATPAPAAPAAPAATPAAPAVDVAGELAKLEQAKADIAKKERHHVHETRRLSEQKQAHEAEKKTWGEKLSRLGELEKREKFAKTNPAGFLQSIYGDKWYDVVVEAKLSGVAPADLIASEFEKLRGDIDAKFSEREANEKKAQEAAQSQAIETTRRTLLANAKQFLAANAKDYPLMSGEKADQFARALAQRIETDYNEKWSKNQATGATTTPLSIKEAADLVDAELVAMVEQAAGHEKYRAKLGEKLKPTPMPASQRTSPPQRKSLSNDLTGSTPSREAPKTDAERRQRAIAAQNAILQRTRS